MDYNKLKRILDIIFSVISLTILSPALLAIGTCVKLDSKGHIIFKSKRVGKDGKEFNIYKFRTMIENNEADNLQKDDKVTKIGRFLRQTGLDELPQLINILKGEMSFIGPRPVSSKFYKLMTDEQKMRLDVKPGILGPIKCTMDGISMTDRISEDLNYIENYSLKTDLRIIFEFIFKYKEIVSNRKGSSYGNKKNIIKQISNLKDNKIKEEMNELNSKLTDQELIFIEDAKSEILTITDQEFDQMTKQRKINKTKIYSYYLKLEKIKYKYNNLDNQLKLVNKNND